MLLTDAPGLDISANADIAMLPSVDVKSDDIIYPSLDSDDTVVSYVEYVFGTEVR